MLGYFLDPMQRCCVSEKPPCIKNGSGVDPAAEIFDEPPSAPSSVELLIEERHIRGGALPAGPKDRLIRTFAVVESESMQGAPLRTGNILQLRLGVAIEDISLSLYVNGFSLAPRVTLEDDVAPGDATCIGWSPFSLVEKCQVKTMQHSSLWAVFKLTVFRQEGDDRYYYFATTGQDAFQERDQWVDEISGAIRRVTQSLFPPHGIAVRPLPGVESTCTRIMAGYLLRCVVGNNVSLVYCELHAYSGGEAHLAIYKDEWCEREHASLQLTDQTIVSTRKGSYCTVFGVDQNRFCARTREEKELWLRAVSNIKVKLMFDAPDPTSQELAVFRAAILERIVNLEETHDNAQGAENSCVSSREPLLPSVPRPPTPCSPEGDVWHPEPIEECADRRSLPEPLWQASQDGETELLAASVASEVVPPSPRPSSSPNDEVLQPEDCRKLLMSVGAMVSFDSESRGGAGAAAGAAVVAAERPGAIRTVHSTEKAPGHRCAPMPEDVCRMNCQSADTGGTESPWPQEESSARPSVPLLTWAPSRRQSSQRAV